MPHKKTGSTPKLPPWEPCDRLMEQQRPAAPIREPSERRFHLENVAGFQGRRRKKANCLWFVKVRSLGDPPRMADCVCGRAPPDRPHYPLTVRERQPAVNHPSQLDRHGILQLNSLGIRQGSREQPCGPLPTAVAGIPGIRRPLLSAEAGAGADTDSRENSGNRVRSRHRLRKKQVEGRELRPTESAA